MGEGPLWSIPVLRRATSWPTGRTSSTGTTSRCRRRSRRWPKPPGGEETPASPASSPAARQPRSMGTGFISGLKSYTDGQWSELDRKLHANLHDPRSVRFTETWVDMVRDSGPPNWANMQWYDAMEAFTAGQAGMIGDADFFAANYKDPEKSKVAGKVGYALIPLGPGGKTYSGLWTWALGMSRATRTRRRPGSSCSGRRRRAPCSTPRSTTATTIPRAPPSPNDPRVQETMGRGAAAATSRPWPRTSRPPRSPGARSPSAAARRHLGARPARDLLQAHVGGRCAQEGQQRDRRVLKEAGIK